MVQGQHQQRLLPAQLLQPVAQLPLTLASVHPLPLPVGIVGVLDRQVRQADPASLAVAGVELDQLVDHHPHRPAIGDDMVLGQDQHMFVRRHSQQAGPQQRTAAQVEGGWRLLSVRALSCSS